MIKLFSKNTYKHSYLLLDLGTGHEKSTTDVNAWKFMIRFGFSNNSIFQSPNKYQFNGAIKWQPLLLKSLDITISFFGENFFGKRLNMKAGKHQRWKDSTAVYVWSCLTVHNPWMVFSSQIVTQIINTMSLLVR